VQGSTINFEVLGRRGEVIGYKEVGQQLGDAGFHVRTGGQADSGQGRGRQRAGQGQAARRAMCSPEDASLCYPHLDSPNSPEGCQS
jgi:hypothetical protein